MQSILNAIQTSAANGLLSAMVPVESSGNRTEGSPDGEDHKNLPISDSSASGQKVWPPGPLKETDHRTGTWQMLLPVEAHLEASLS